MSESARYMKLKKQHDKLQREYNRAEGRLEDAMLKLKDFGVTSVEEADDKIKVMESTTTKKKKKAKRLMDKFEEDWSGYLE